jgi:threonine/homoserine/homoserine lactone efflux protein
VLVLNLMLIGVAVALDPLPLTAFLIVLPCKRGTVKGAAFVFGWLVFLAIVVTITVAATGNNPPKPATVPSLASLAIKIALGLVLVQIAIRHIRARGQPKPPKSRPSGKSTWTTCPPGSPWSWPRRCSPGC